MAPPSTQTLLFIGSTGGVTNACLVNALRSQTATCIALVRTPSRLHDQLKAQNLTPDQLAHLTTITGNGKTIADLKTALLAGGNNNQLPDTIITGLGSGGSANFNISQPLKFFALDDPTICGDAAKALVAALKELYAEREELAFGAKPTLVFVSTTGISRVQEDVPFAMRYFYHQILKEPHEDKKVMEEVYRKAGEGEERVFSVISGVRPTWLLGEVDADSGKGLHAIRAGTEKEPEMGYGIHRADVGKWMWENLVRPGEGRRRWEGEMCSLTGGKK